MKKTFEVEILLDSGYNYDYDNAILFMEHCQDFFNSCSTNEKLVCQVQYDINNKWIYFKNPKGVLSVCGYFYDVSELFDESDNYDDMCEFLRDIDVDRAEIINVDLIEIEQYTDRWGDTQKESHYKMTVTLFEDEIAEEMRNNMEDYAQYQYEQEMNEESAYYALGGNGDYDRFKRNGGDLDDVLELLGH